jgi:3-methyladenine DNA glycosylase AlkC
MFDAARFRSVAREMAGIDSGFDRKRFLKLALKELEHLSLMQRLRRMTESLYATLPADYPAALDRLRELAPRIDKAFVTLVLPDFVGCYGHGHFAESMAALKFFTRFGSSEFAVREFLRRDLPRTLAVMRQWSEDEDEHVRRLASEGCRPRLPWSFRLEVLIADPTPVLPILENLKSDPSLYVRKSVANHLNDITKTHPDLVLDRLRGWPLENPGTAWMARQALRTLIKQGHAPALKVIGATGRPEVALTEVKLHPARLRLGDSFILSFQVASTAGKTQRLVVDYAVHYVKKSGAASAKVFKWKEITLPPGAVTTLSRRQTIRNFTTRVHYAGHHEVEILINGESLARTGFALDC